MNTFTWNGVNCSAFGMLCSHGGTYNAPEPDVEVIEIPGRSGTLTIDNKRYKNAPGVFRCKVTRSFAQNAGAIRAWLNSSRGYCRLEDDAHPYEYRMARHASAIIFDPLYIDKEAEITITFDCMPQRFLKSGEEVVTLTAAGSLINPTLFEAQPIITVRGSGAGSLTVNGRTVAISEIGTSVTLNTEILRAYSGTTRRDQTIAGKIEHLRLQAGENAVSFTGGVSAVEIIPRWWTI